MIKKLRVKFIAAIMAIVTMMLLIIFGFVLHNTYFALEKESLEAMRDFSAEGMRPGMGSGDGFAGRMPMFSLELRPDGTLLAAGSSWFDLTDEAQLRQLYLTASGENRKSGTLEQWGLRYYRAEGPGTGKYVFMDISVRLKMLQDLVLSCVLVFLAAVAVFFVISLWLSKWIIRPVEEAWQQQRQFVADASHELKTPLKVILTNAELLASEEYDPAAFCPCPGKCGGWWKVCWIWPEWIVAREALRWRKWIFPPCRRIVA